MSRGNQKTTHYVPRPLLPDQLTPRPRSRPDAAVAALAEYDNGELSYFVQQVVRLGYCVSFSATSDGGAISIVCFDGFRRYKGYCRKEDDYPTRFRDLLSELRGEE